MFKVLEFDAFRGDDQVVFAVNPHQPMSKQASWAVKLASPVRAFCDSIEARPDRRYFVSVALGAGETWGMNKNGDWFPRSALEHEGDKYGYETFLKAGRYRHHVNKDPSKSMGKVVLAHWNPDMDRVELVSWIDTSKAPDITERLDRFEETGEKIATSMGCRVPYDRCSRCGHKAASVKQYCGHLKHAMGKIVAGGHANYAINDFPRFFDDSFVLMPAASEAGVTMKVAEARPGPIVVLSAQRGLEVYGEDKAGAIDKKLPAELKEVLTPDEVKEMGEGRQLMADLTPVLQGNEPDVMESDAHKLSSLPIEHVLATSAAMGFVLKPSEFQKIALASLGAGGRVLARQLEIAGVEFDPNTPAVLDKAAEIDPPAFNGAHIDPRVADVLAPYREKRSYWEPWFSKRVEELAQPPVMRKIARGHIWKHRKTAVWDTALPLALGYALYRLQLGKADPGMVDQLIKKHPALAVPLLGVTAGMLHTLSAPPPRVNEKTAGFATRYAIPGFAPYIYGAGVQRKEQKGYRLSGFERFAKEHPGLLSLLGIGAAGIVARKSHAVGKALEGLTKGGAEIPEDEAALVAMLQGAERAPGNREGLLTGAAKNVMAGVYRARHFPGALVDEYVFRKLLG